MHQQLYLSIGDQVFHNRFPQWGIGTVIEALTSVLSGGSCFVRVSFYDGVERCFFNNLGDHNCCYYAGVRLFEAAPRKKTNLF